LKFQWMANASPDISAASWMHRYSNFIRKYHSFPILVSVNWIPLTPRYPFLNVPLSQQRFFSWNSSKKASITQILFHRTYWNGRWSANLFVNLSGGCKRVCFRITTKASSLSFQSLRLSPGFWPVISGSRIKESLPNHSDCRLAYI